MKNALMLVGTYPWINVGDYIQAIAASQFFDHVDMYIEREHLNSYKGEPVNMIMNGWFMHHPENWPPSNFIHPLFVAFHINSSVEESMLSDESIAYLKLHEPIGCRDIYTLNLLRSKGVDAYFSACLTLTLGMKYNWQGQREGKCYFVDPYVGNTQSRKWLLKSTLYTLFNYSSVCQQDKKMYGGKRAFRNILKAAGFLWINNKVFSKDLIDNASYACHWIENDSLYPSDLDKITHAESLIKEYAKASLVITSRIHCALPCLGLDTPVLYLHNLNLIKDSYCRLEGLIELLTVINCDNNVLIPQFELNGKINLSTKIENKKSAKRYIRELINTCKKWTS